MWKELFMGSHYFLDHPRIWEEFEFRPDSTRTAELAALEHPKKIPRLIIGEMLYALYLLHF